MILNAFAILSMFVALLRLGTACLLIALAFRAGVMQRNARVEDKHDQESRGYLLIQLAFLLLVLNVTSWPLLYLLLESYVPEWPGVMCIFGVTQVGEGSIGPSRFLPGLLRALQVLKPALVFASGAWLVIYVANRRTSSSPLLGRSILAIAGVGMLAAVDAAAEGAYLLIPKQEEFLSVGCCTAAFGEDDGRFATSAILAGGSRLWLWAAYVSANVVIIVVMGGMIRRTSSSDQRSRTTFLLLGALLTAGICIAFLIDIAAPALLRLPHHHCPYDLVGRAPESLLGLAAFACGTFAVGWAWVAAWFADCSETRHLLGGLVRQILVIGFFGYLSSFAMMLVELALAWKAVEP